MIKRWLLALSLILLALFLIGCTDDLLTGKAKGGGATTAKPQCSDGKDNDGDGRCDLLGCKIQRTNYLPDPGCTSILDNDETDPLPPPPVAFDFQISVPENYLSVVAGRSTSTIVKAVATNSGTPQLVTFSASDLPSGAAVSFDPASCTPFCANPAGCQVECPSTATYTTSSSTPSGFFVTRVEGTSGNLMHYYTVYLTVNTTNQTNQSVPPIPPPGNQTNQTNMTGGGSGSINCWQRAYGKEIHYPGIERTFRTDTVAECQENTRMTYTEYACQYDPVYSTHAYTKTDSEQAWNAGSGDCCCKVDYSCVVCAAGRPPVPPADDPLCGTRPDQGCTCTVMAWDGNQYSGQRTNTVWSEQECQQWGDTQKSQVCGPGQISYDAMYYIYGAEPPNGGQVGGGCCCTQPGDPTTCMACPS